MISVIVPFKDSEPWLARCLESLIKQEGDLEFLLIDDHSSDKGKEIVTKYAERDPRIILLSNERGPGVSGARNTGMDHAKGEWITFLDADDEMLDGAIAAFMGEMGPNKNIIQFNHLRNNGRDFQKKSYMYDTNVFTTIKLPEPWWGVWNKLFRSDFVKKIRFDESLQYGEDGLFVLECLAKDDHIYHAAQNRVTVRHRFDNKSSLSKVKTTEDIVKQIRTYESFLFCHDDIPLQHTVCLELSKLWLRISENFE